MPRPHSCLKILIVILIVIENPPGITSRKDRQERKGARQRPHPAFTPTALNSKAQCRAVALRSMVAHAGLPITYMTEPQRGSTMNQHSIRQLQRKISAICVKELTGHDTSIPQLMCLARMPPVHIPYSSSRGIPTAIIRF